MKGRGSIRLSAIIQAIQSRHLDPTLSSARASFQLSLWSFPRTLHPIHDPPPFPLPQHPQVIPWTPNP